MERTISSFEVICDATNNSPEAVANRELFVEIKIVPDDWQFLATISDGKLEVERFARLSNRWFSVLSDGQLQEEVVFVEGKK